MTDSAKNRRDGSCLPAAVALLLAAVICPNTSHSQVSLNIGSGTTLNADAVTTTISGNLAIEGSFNPGSGTLVFDGRGTQRIVSNRPELVNDLHIDKASGDFILLNDLTVNRLLLVERGTLHLDGYMLTLASNAVVRHAERIQGTLGRISAQQRINNVDSLNIGGVGCIFSTRANLGNVSVVRGHLAQRIDGVPGISRYYELFVDRSPNRDVEIRFTYAISELNGIPERDLVMYRSADEGESWVLVESEVDEERNAIKVTTRQVAGLWTAGSRSRAASVLIRDVSASVRRHETILTWTSISQTEVSGFEIQVWQGEQFEPIEFVEISAVGSGTHSHSHTLGGLQPGRHVLRVVPVTAHGRLEAVNEVEVVIDSFGDYALTEPYPNPFNSQTSVKLVLAVSQRVQVEVFDIQGRRVMSLHEGILAAHEEHEFTFSGEGLPSSVYLFRLAGETFTATRRALLVR